MTSTDIKNGALTGEDLGPGAVDRPQIQFDAVGGEEIESGTVEDSDLAVSVIRPVAVGVFNGTCIDDDNCPLVANQGVTGFRHIPASNADYCIDTGGEGDLIVATPGDTGDPGVSISTYRPGDPEFDCDSDELEVYLLDSGNSRPPRDAFSFVIY